jgi:hypothetical protein
VFWSHLRTNTLSITLQSSRSSTISSIFSSANKQPSRPCPELIIRRVMDPRRPPFVPAAPQPTTSHFSNASRPYSAPTSTAPTSTGPRQYIAPTLTARTPTPRVPISSSSWVRPVLTPATTYPFECKRCSVKFPNWIAHNTHNHESIRHNFCRTCPHLVDFESFRDLQKHLEERHFYCEVCDWSAPSREGLTSHNVSVHHMCGVCGRYFGAPHELQGVSFRPGIPNLLHSAFLLLSH